MPQHVYFLIQPKPKSLRALLWYTEHQCLLLKLGEIKASELCLKVLLLCVQNGTGFTVTTTQQEQQQRQKQQKYFNK